MSKQTKYLAAAKAYSGREIPVMKGYRDRDISVVCSQAAGRGLLSLIARQSDKTWTPFDTHLLLRYPIADTAKRRG